MQETPDCTESVKMLRRPESIDYVTAVAAVFSLLVAVAVKALAATLAGQAIIRLSVDQFRVLFPPDRPALVAAECSGPAFAVLRNRTPAVAAALFLLGLTAAN